MLAPALAKIKLPYVIPNGAAELDLSGKKLGDATAADLMDDILKNHTTLKKLKLLDNRITDNGATAIARSLSQNTVLERLSLGRNHIEDEGCAALAKMLSENTTLRRLYLGDNPITDKGATAMARVLEKNSTLKELALSRCDLTDTCIPPWCDVIRKNETLQKLKISPAGNVGISAMGARLLLRAIKENDTLKDLWILAYSSRAGSFRPAALVSGLKGRRETVAIMQQEITNQLRRPLHERKKLKEASRQAPPPNIIVDEEISTSPPTNGSVLGLRPRSSAPSFGRDLESSSAPARTPPVDVPPPQEHNNNQARTHRHAKHKSIDYTHTTGTTPGHLETAHQHEFFDLGTSPPPCTLKEYEDLQLQVAHLRKQVASLEAHALKKDRRNERRKAELADQRNLTTHLQGQLDILSRELQRSKEKCESRGRKILHLREQLKLLTAAPAATPASVAVNHLPNHVPHEKTP